MIAIASAPAAIARASPPRPEGTVQPRGSAAFCSVSMGRPVMVEFTVQMVGLNRELLDAFQLSILSNAVLEDLRNIIEFAPCLRHALAYHRDGPHGRAIDIYEEEFTVLSDLQIGSGTTLYVRIMHADDAAQPIGVVLPNSQVFSSFPVEPNTPVGYVSNLLTHMMFLPSAYSLAINCQAGGLVRMQTDTFSALPVHAINRELLFLVESAMTS